MKKTISITAIFVIAALCLMPLSYIQASEEKTTIQDVKQETQDLISKLKAYTADQRDEAIKQTEQALKNLDKRIDELETDVYNSWDKLDKNGREKAQAGLKELRKQRIELAEWYGSLKNSQVSTWDKMKKGFLDAYQAVIDAWAKFRREY